MTLQIVELAVIVVAIALLYLQADHHQEDIYRREKAWRLERSDLITRIQTGKPTVQAVPFEPPEPREPDELHKIGTISPPSSDDAA